MCIKPPGISVCPGPQQNSAGKGVQVEVSLPSCLKCRRGQEKETAASGGDQNSRTPDAGCGFHIPSWEGSVVGILSWVVLTPRMV